MNFYNQFIKTLSDKSYETVKHTLETQYNINTYLDINLGAYILLHNDNTKKHTDFDDELNKQMVYNTRGLIVEYTLHKPVCNAVPIQIELDKFELPTLKHEEIYNYMEIVEGTYIRLYFHNGVWRFATTRMMDSSHPRAKWSTNKTFKQLFLDVLTYKSTPIDFSKLNVQYTYQFILQHPENRVVHSHTNYGLNLYALYDNLTLQQISVQSDDYIFNICSKIEKHKLTMEDTIQITHTIEDDTTNELGYMVFDETYCYKISTNVYKHDAGLILNTASIVERFIKLIRTISEKEDEDEETAINKYKKSFPEDVMSIENLENKLNHIVNDVYRLYGMRFKRPSSNMPRRILTPNDGFIQTVHYPILLGIHKLYCDVLQPQHKTVQLEDVKNFIVNTCDEKKTVKLLEAYVNVTVN